MLIEIFHDTACPWCRIGKKHLFDALQKWQGEKVDIRWHPFLLDDTIPPEGIEFRSFMKSRKEMQPKELEQLFEYTQKKGEAAGVRFNFKKISLAVNTKLSHQLIAIAPKEIKTQVVDAIYKAYFEDGLNIGNIEVLVYLGKSVGMDAAELRYLLEANVACKEVEADAIAAQKKGITSVPHFILNGRVSVSGSHSVNIFLQALDRAVFSEVS